ncbi:MAG TPA: ATP-binding protein [Acidimicrobiales bacterium]|nr:ATP-binding protein [Acidimicrobiales bacterium]
MVDRYLAQTEDELDQLGAEGLLAEDHHIDLKRELGNGSKANKELARDLASLAIDGGALYIGVAEGEAGEVPRLHPVQLQGLPERIDQVARSAITPPLRVHPRVVPSRTTVGGGYLVVRVPPSPDAPHMVDGRYWGRGALTKEQLSDAQVRDVFERRSRAREDAGQLLMAVTERDPTPPELRDQAHLFVLARPLFAPGDLLLRAFGTVSGTEWLGNNVLRGQPAEAPSQWAPDLVSNASNLSRRAQGWALHSYEVGEDRSLRSSREDRPPMETGLLDLEFDEDGTVRLFCGRATDTVRSTRVAIDVLIAGLTRRVVVTASVIARDGTYFGPWVLGLAVTNLAGAVSLFENQNMMGQAVPYSEEEYRMTTEGSFEELQEQADVLVERLFGRLNRALTGGHFDSTRIVVQQIG